MQSKFYILIFTSLDSKREVSNRLVGVLGCFCKHPSTMASDKQTEDNEPMKQSSCKETKEMQAAMLVVKEGF
jgi:hypothetical protein